MAIFKNINDMSKVEGTEDFQNYFSYEIYIYNNIR